ncbi:MAG: efflux RND transporter periplasmic adaptor subunit, partial [Planctomycetota bacterium]|nr:efflux RND transporter periplasmic adaptor subunit [Planctomycetota bacterium]
GAVPSGTEALVNVDAYPQKTFEGVVSYVAPSVDPRTRNVEIEIELDNQDGFLKAGMFARIELVIDLRKDIIAIPKDMIMYGLIDSNTKGYIVYILNGEIAKKVPVKTGIYSRGMIEIKEGLAGGEKIIESVGSHIYDGCRVKITNPLQDKSQ